MDITSEAIRYDNKIIPTRNISSAQMVERQVDLRISDQAYKARRKRYLKIGGGMLAAGIVFFLLPYQISVTIRDLFYNVLPGFIIWNIEMILFLLAVAISVYGLFRPVRKFWQYGVSLQTNSGSVDLLWSQDRQFIERLRDIIFRAITSSGTNIQYSVNVDNREIHDNSQTTFNTTNHFDYSVSFTEHKGLSAEDLRFLSGAFNAAMSELGSSLSGSDAVISELKRLQEALNQPEPDKGTLRKTYDRLKDACDLTETATTTVGLLGTIWAGVSMFL